MIRITTTSAQETQKISAMLAVEIQNSGRRAGAHAVVIALNGDLGAGKTTFTQGFARSLGIKERITSPTFVLMKIYRIARDGFKHLVHIDCYRVDRPEELLHLGLDEILEDRDAIVLIEWADRIRRVLPDDVIELHLGHGKKINERTIDVRYGNQRDKK